MITEFSRQWKLQLQVVIERGKLDPNLQMPAARIAETVLKWKITATLCGVHNGSQQTLVSSGKRCPTDNTKQMRLET